MRADEFQRLALIDPLTGLCNRRMAEERLAAEASRSCRYGHPLTVVAFDLDDFKQVNDTYGHPVGGPGFEGIRRAARLGHSHVRFCLAHGRRRIPGSAARMPTNSSVSGS